MSSPEPLMKSLRESSKSQLKVCISIKLTFYKIKATFIFCPRLYNYNLLSLTGFLQIAIKH